MSDEWALFAVLGLVYLTDCFCWAGSNTVAFVGALGARRAQRVRGDLLQAGEGGLILLNPLPPFGSVFCCRLLPLALSPEGFATHPPSGSPACENGRSPTTRPWDESQAFEVRNRHVTLDGERLVRCDDSGQASSVCALLNQLAKTPPGERPLIIDRFWEQRFDLKSARTRLESATSHLRYLRWGCTGLFGLLFVVAPAAVLYGGRVDRLIPLGLATLASVLWIVIRFNTVFKACFPEATDERVTHLIKMALCPPASIRACDLVTESLLADHHPLVIAYLLVDRERYKTLAAKTLRSLRFPIVPGGEAGYAGPVAWQNDNLLQKVETFLEGIDLSAAELLSPPAPHAPDVKAYCPRCLEQFMEARGECPDCAGVMRSPFDKGKAVLKEGR